MTRRTAAFGATALAAFVPAFLSAQTQVAGRVRGLVLGGVAPVVYLVPADSVVAPTDVRNVLMDQTGWRFEPTVQVVLPGTTVEFRNSDPILHNVFSPSGPGAGFDLGTYPAGESRDHTFIELGTHLILCHVHPDMYAYVVVLPTRYFGMLDASGSFRIEGVPGGRYTVRVWQRRALDYEASVTVGRDMVALTLDLDGSR